MSVFNNIEILQIAASRKKHLIILGILAILLGIVFSGETFIKPKYKSTATLYPVNIVPYSLESSSEQLVQLFQSSDVRTLMVKKFNLGKRYNIESKNPENSIQLAETYEENILIRKTEFESIKITVLDGNADTACAMVNGLIDCMNEQAKYIQRQKSKENLKLYRTLLDEKLRQIDSLELRNNMLRTQYGLLDYTVQSKASTASLLKLTSEGASKEKLKASDTLLKNLKEKGGEQISIVKQLKGLYKSYNNIRDQYDLVKNDLAKELTYANVVSKPFPADTKSYPVRTLIVSIFTLSTLLLGMLLFILIERGRTKPNADTRIK
ncbi:MAG: hypothetical protein EXR20_07690 [Bacteroidetes bacterium]|nr:hypothetical protein [Bacteroidota bacterium]PHX81962.1 MAG: hypothetical protein CK539_07065 [Flavobacteriales bacterium]